jgi:hypothetical protein
LSRTIGQAKKMVTECFRLHLDTLSITLLNSRKLKRITHDDRRKEILAVAETLFLENGYHLTTKQTLAKIGITETPKNANLQNTLSFCTRKIRQQA